jgi:wyosine [tRNA(Phe)-imidazoG37] synthetase (radical SAM superfamily)
MDDSNMICKVTNKRNMFQQKLGTFLDYYTLFSIFADCIIGITQVMSTIIYPSPIFGPVHSRRLGLSLGINLQPNDGKLCTFDCIYCECGFNSTHRAHHRRPTREEVHNRLEETLQQMHDSGEHPDVLTFAGNGEPTAHPDFVDIIDDTLALRDALAPQARVSVLSNATMIHREGVREALMKIDNNIQKLDTVDINYIRAVDRPVSKKYNVDEIIRNLKLFHGHVVIQTMFMKGFCTIEEEPFGVDNTSDEYVLPWLAAVKDIAPREVMIYTIDRETPDQGLEKATPEELNRIRDLVIAAGIPCTASY